MAERDVIVRIKAEIGAFKRDMAAAADAAKKTAKETESAGKAAESGIGKLSQTAQAHDKAWNTVANGMVASGTAIVGALALSTKAAIDWESAWAGVTKTVDGSPQQMAQLEGELRNLAKTLPSTHSEIAAVAEAAGQLGVARKDVSGFTKTMIDLGESTNLTAEDAATNIAQISNVMGTMEREGSLGVQRFGSALVALGNDGASTESDILSMAQRISGAGATIGASEADVLALSNTLASMGVKAELGGGVTTRVLLKMRTAVDEGGDSLESFAKVAGVSADEFATKFREAPVEALDLVSKGINGVNESGGNVTATLKEMGIKGTEETQVMLALANSGDLLTDSLNLGSKAWEENTALVAEANKRYETAESKIKIAWNNIKDNAIDAGAVILPEVAGIADAVAAMSGAFSDLPGPVKTGLTVLGGVGGVGLLAAGGLMKLATNLSSALTGMQNLGIATPKATKAVGLLGKTLGGITAVGAGILIGKTVIEGINEAARSGKPDVEAYFNVLATGGDLVNTLKEVQGDDWNPLSNFDDIDQLRNSIEWLTGLNEIENPLIKWSTENLTLFSRTEVNNAKDLAEGLKAVGRAFDMGQVELGTKTLADFADQMNLTDQDVGALINSVPELKTALTNLATENGIQIDPNNELGLVDLALGRIALSAPGAADGTNKLNSALSGTAAEAEIVAKSLDDILASVFALGRDSRSVSEAQDALTGSISALNASIAENGKKFTGNSEAALKNREALRTVADESEGVVEAQARVGASAGEIQSSMQTTYDALMKATGGSESLVRELMGIPKDVKVSTWMSESAKEIAEGTANAIELIPGYTKVGIAVSEDGTVGQVQSKINSVTGKEEYIFVTEKGTAQVQAGIANIKGKDVPVWVDDNGTVYSTSGKIQGIKGKNVTIFADAETRDAYNKLSALERDRWVTIHTRVVGGGSQTSTGRGGRGGLTENADGGRASLPGYTAGGQLPSTGLGTDQILAMTSMGNPIAWVDDREWIINNKSSDKYNGILSAINRDDPAVQHLAGLASGGRVGSAERKVADLQKQIRRVPGTKANRSRKADLQDRLDDAKAELKAAKAEVAAAKKRTEAENKKAKEAREKAAEARKAEAERRGRVNELRFDLQRDLKRGEITDSFTSGSGMSVVDRLFEQSNNKDLSKGKRSSLRSTAYGMESQLLSLEKRSESLKTKLEKATEARDRLLEVSKSVASGLRGEYSLGNVISNLVDKDFKGTLTAGSFVKSAQGKARQIRQFGELLAKLRKKGYNEAIIQEIADLGTAEGTQVGNALLGASSSERKQLNNAYEAMDYWSDKAGVEVTRSMKQGGIDSAQGLVDGLTSKTKDVENAFYKLGKNAENAFKRSLGIKSPSKNAKGWSADVVAGSVIGLDENTPKLETAMENLGKAGENAFAMQAALTVPPSYEVSRYAQAQASGRNFTDADIAALANVMITTAQSSPINNTLKIDGRAFAKVMTNVNQNYNQRR